MFITHCRKITARQITPTDALAIDPENALKLVGLPRKNNRGKTILILTKDQTVNGHISEVKQISLRIETTNVLTEITNSESCHGPNFQEAIESLPP